MAIQEGDELVRVLNALRHLIGNQIPERQRKSFDPIVLNALRHLIGNQSFLQLSDPRTQRCSTPYGI